MELWATGKIIIESEENISVLLKNSPEGTACIKISYSFFSYLSDIKNDLKAVFSSMGPFVIVYIAKGNVILYNPPLAVLKYRNFADIAQLMENIRFYIVRKEVICLKSELLKDISTTRTYPIASPMISLESNILKKFILEIFGVSILQSFLSKVAKATNIIAPTPAATASNSNNVQINTIEELLSKCGLPQHIPVFQEEQVTLETLRIEQGDLQSFLKQLVPLSDIDNIVNCYNKTLLLLD